MFNIYFIVAVYEAQESATEEPAAWFVPLGSGSNGNSSNAAEQSLLLLGDGLASGAALSQFESLARRAPDAVTEAASLPHNLAKNRYRDIAPCNYSFIF